MKKDEFKSICYSCTKLIKQEYVVAHGEGGKMNMFYCKGEKILSPMIMTVHGQQEPAIMTCSEYIMNKKK